MRNKKFVFVVLLILTALITSGATTDSDIDKMIEGTHPADVIRISAEELFAAYEANEIRADSTYKGSVLVVKGTVRAIRQEQGRIYAELAGDKYGFSPIRCYFSQGKGHELVSYVKGNQIVLKGMGLGRSVIGIVLAGCTISIW